MVNRDKVLFVGKIVDGTDKSVCIGAVFYNLSIQGYVSIRRFALEDYFKQVKVFNCSYINNSFHSLIKELPIKGYPVYNRRGSIIRDGFSLQDVITFTGNKFSNLLRSNISVTYKPSDIITAGALYKDVKLNKTKMDIHAEKYYELIRRSKPFGISLIAKRVGITKEDVLRVRKYIFIDKHDLGRGFLERFAPDYYMALSWQRLASKGMSYGRPEQVLILHELLEMQFKATGACHSKAHDMANKVYNYAETFEEYYNCRMF